MKVLIVVALFVVAVNGVEWFMTTELPKPTDTINSDDFQKCLEENGINIDNPPIPGNGSDENIVATFEFYCKIKEANDKCGNQSQSNENEDLSLICEDPTRFGENFVCAKDLFIKLGFESIIPNYEDCDQVDFMRYSVRFFARKCHFSKSFFTMVRKIIQQEYEKCKA